MNVSVGRRSTERGERITVRRRVEAPADVVWEVLTDTERWPDWGPPVTDVDYPDGEIVPDTTGDVEALGVLDVPFRIEDVDDEVWTWTAWGRTPPADGHRVEPIGDDACRVTLELPLWAPWYVPLCVVALRNVAGLVEDRDGVA